MTSAWRSRTSATATSISSSRGRSSATRSLALLTGGQPYRPPVLVGDLDPMGALTRAVSGMRRRISDMNPFRNGDDGDD